MARPPHRLRGSAQARPRARPGLLFALLPLALQLGACGSGASDTAPAAGTSSPWVELARGFRPPPLEERARALEASLAAPRASRFLRRGAEDEELWLEVALPRAAWTRSDDPADAAPEVEGQPNGTVWSTPLPRGGALLASVPHTLTVLDGEQELARARPKLRGPGRFWVVEDTLWIGVANGAEPSEALVCRLRLDAGRERDGVWRVEQADLACDGFLALPGVPERITLDIPPGSALGFTTVAPDPDGRGAALPPTTFRVKLDGELRFEHVQTWSRPLRWNRHRIELGVSGRHELTFEVEGPAAAPIATPTLEPLAIGTPGARPWGAARPDLVLLLCDTFRADNLVAWGGKESLAPRLNGLVERSLRFLDARSTAAWTLPSIGTILSGVFPGQHGGTDFDRGVSSEVETVAEVLARQGYRTAAVTDSGFFSRHFNQDQGFAWFTETPVDDWNLNDTLARARAQMAADDGRPLFLVVHTYRVHGPMRVGPDEDPGPARVLRLEMRRRYEELKAGNTDETQADLALEFSAQGQLYYEDSVGDLDTKVGRWLDDLERDGFFRRGALVFTSDHGNARGEHGQIGHGGTLYDVKLRVPLTITGLDLEPAAVRGPVSQIDLAPTFASLVGAEPSPSWMGRSLLGRRPEGPIYAFDLMREHHEVALYSGGHKLLAPDLDALREGRPSRAFDLEADPGEEEDVVTAAAWPPELARSLVEALEPLIVPLAEGGPLQLDADVLEGLRNIGYGR